LARSRAALSTRPRRIRRGRSRGVAGVLAQLLFEAADPLLEPSVGDGQPLERLLELEDELDTALPASIVDRLGFGSIHAPGFAGSTGDPCYVDLRLNAYARSPKLQEDFRQHSPRGRRQNQP